MNFGTRHKAKGRGGEAACPTEFVSFYQASGSEQCLALSQMARKNEALEPFPVVAIQAALVSSASS